MTALRMRMDNDMLVRGMAERTREAYLAAVARLARHYRRAPDRLSPEEVQAYLVHMLREEHLAWSTCNIAVQAFRFLYHTTLGHPEPTFTIPGPKHRQTLPEILSPGEVRRLLEHTGNRKQRAVLATTYAPRVQGLLRHGEDPHPELLGQCRVHGTHPLGVRPGSGLPVPLLARGSSALEYLHPPARTLVAARGVGQAGQPQPAGAAGSVSTPGPVPEDPAGVLQGQTALLSEVATP